MPSHLQETFLFLWSELLTAPPQAKGDAIGKRLPVVRRQRLDKIGRQRHIPHYEVFWLRIGWNAERVHIDAKLRDRRQGVAERYKQVRGPCPCRGANHIREPFPRCS